jgi:ribosomal protein S18 acetylase RimI-like enzyme
MGAETRVVTVLTAAEVADLVELLVAVVADGASVGYLPPLDPVEAEAYWRSTIRPDNVLLVTARDGRIVGTAQLELAMRANGRHRAEVNKVLVHPDCQRQGIGRDLMAAVESEARARGRTTLHLDTREGDPSNALYVRAGFREAGRIPQWARSAMGSLDATVFYYKLLES